MGPDIHHLSHRGLVWDSEKDPWGRRLAGCQRYGRMESEMEPLDLLARQELEALAATCFKHIKNLRKEQKLVSGQNKWHKAHACFHSL